MAGHFDFTERLLRFGEVELIERPTPDEAELLPTFRLLEAAFIDHARSVAGPLLAFEPEIAMNISLWMARACWLYLAPEIEMKPNHELAWPTTPKPTIATHLNIDLILRFGVMLHRRTRINRQDDPLVKDLETMFRQWPLTGVLSDVEAEPTTNLDFGGHRGLQILYAERLLEHDRPKWRPKNGRTREVVEQVFQERGREFSEG